MLETKSDSVNAIGRRALQNIIEQNPDEGVPAEKLFEELYRPSASRCLNNYLTVLSAVSQQILGGHVPPRPKMLTALLFTLCNSDNNIRTTSARLLRALDEKRDDADAASCKLQDFDMSISDRTPAVYFKAQFDISSKLAQAFAASSDIIFSQFSKVFRGMTSPEDQRRFVHVIIPWLQFLDLQPQETGKMTPATYMVLMNLLEISFNYTGPLQHEVGALWATLVSNNLNNIEVILEFTMALTLEKKSPQLVEVARQIIVWVFQAETQPYQPPQPPQAAKDNRVKIALLQQIVPDKMGGEDQLESPSIYRTQAEDKYAHVGQVPLQHTDPHHPVRNRLI